MIERGEELEECNIYVHITAGKLCDYFEGKFKAALCEELINNVSIPEELIKFHVDVNSGVKANTMAVSAVLKFKGTMTMLHEDILIEGLKTIEKEDFAETLATQVKKNIIDKPNVCVDEHHCDQLFVFMALAEGRS